MNERATKNSSHGISMPVSGSGWSEGVTEAAERSKHFSLADSGSGLNILFLAPRFVLQPQSPLAKPHPGRTSGSRQSCQRQVGH